MIRELVRVTRPGGWIELEEASPDENGGAALDQLLAWGSELVRRRGGGAASTPTLAATSASYSSARLTQVGTRNLAIPLGAWGERVGKMMEADFFSGKHALEGVIAPMGIASMVIATREELQAMCASARAYVNQPKVPLRRPVLCGLGPARLIAHASPRWIRLDVRLVAFHVKRWLTAG